MIIQIKTLVFSETLLVRRRSRNVDKDQELKQSEPKSSWEITNITNSQNTKENIWSTK